MHIVACSLTCGGLQDEKLMQSSANRSITTASNPQRKNWLVTANLTVDNCKRNRVNTWLAWDTPCMLCSLLRVSYRYTCTWFPYLDTSQSQKNAKIDDTCNRKFVVVSCSFVCLWQAHTLQVTCITYMNISPCTSLVLGPVHENGEGLVYACTKLS